MAMLAFNLLLLIFLLPMNKLSCAILDDNDNKKLDMLKEMKKWGERVKKSYLPVKNNNIKQFIAVAILSNNIPQDKDKLDLETGCPNMSVTTLTYQCRTSAVILNEDLKENDQRFKKIRKDKDFTNRIKNKTCNPSGWHGEIILIHGGVLETLISNFWHDVGGNETVLCNVYLYSFNIPCAKINNTPYSCSEEIMLYNNEAKNNNRQCRITVVGYTRVYDMFTKSKTDPDAAKKWLHEALVEVFYFTNKKSGVKAKYLQESDGRERKKRLASSDLNLNTDDMIFQDLVYECLSSTHLPFCCLSDPTDTVRQQKILSFFVNSVSYSCTHNSTERGSLSAHSLTDLKRCFSSLLQANIGSDCRICSDGSIQSAWYQQYVIAFCIDGIIDRATTFGRPSDGWDLTNPTWIPWNGPWNNMYLESVHSFQRRENLFCENRMLDIGSICTKMSGRTIRKQIMKNLLIDKYLWP